VTSSELDEDSVIDLGEFLATEAGYAFAVKEDDCGFNGDGTSGYGGMKGIATLFGDGSHNAGRYVASGHTTFDAITATDLALTMGLAPSIALGRAAWFTSPTGFAFMFARLTATAGGCVVMPDVNGRLRPHYLGFPVITTQAITNTGSPSGKLMAAFGDLSLAATLGDRREVTLARATQGAGLFENDSVGYRVTERVDVVVHDLGDNATAGPIVGLIGG
jgi:HK97 family phage major capsid protein